MAHSFNLVDQPWVPCVTNNGTTMELSLRDTFAQAQSVRELGGESPLVTAALYRLLLAIVHRVLAPGADPDAWILLWEEGGWPLGAFDAYLTTWRHRFDLFDTERPFYQQLHPKAPRKSLVSLVYELSSGNNSTLFDHSSEERGIALSEAQAARALVAAQSFGLGGLSPVSGERFTDGPAARGITFLVQGNTLQETLLLNLLPYPSGDIMGTRDDDCPAWENDSPFKPLSRVPRGLLDYLTWQNRRVVLLPEEGPRATIVREMLLGPGLRMDGLVLDPLKHYHRSKDPKEGMLVLRFGEGRALWRDSAALLGYTPPDDKGECKPPYALTWLRWLMDNGIPGIRSDQTKRLLGFGMANDRAKVNFYRREELPLPLAYLSDQNNVLHLEQAIGLAEDAGHHLWGALSSLATEVLFHKAAQGLSQQDREQRDNLLTSWGADRHYWAALELPFYELIADLPRNTQPARAAWAAVVRRAAWQALEGAIAGLGEDPASLKAAVTARGQLGGGLHKAFDGWPGSQQAEQEVNYAG